MQRGNFNSFPTIIEYLLVILCIGISLSVFFPSCVQSEEVKTDVGDVVSFGQYMQTTDETVLSPIEWIVLEKDKKTFTLLSTKILEIDVFHDKEGGEYWSKSSLRKWLNNDFYNLAFSNEEKKAIVSSTHQNSIYDSDGYEKKQSSKEKVFILSIQEAARYFNKEKSGRGDHLSYSLISDYEEIDQTKAYYIAEATEYAKRTHREYKFLPHGTLNDRWWLRNSYCVKSLAAITGSHELRFRFDHDTTKTLYGIRPAIVVSSQYFK